MVAAQMTGRFKRIVRAMQVVRGEECGATAAEFALVVPTFLLLVFGTINAGLAMSAVIQVHYAAQKAARCLSADITGSCTAGNIDTVAKAYYGGPGMTGLTFTASAPSCGNKVTGSGSYDLVTGFSSTAVTITANACYPNI